MLDDKEYIIKANLYDGLECDDDIVFYQNDTRQSKIIAEFTGRKRAAIDVTNCTVVCVIQKSDKEIVTAYMNNNNISNRAEYVLSQNALASIGKGTITIFIYDNDNGRQTFGSIKFKVLKDVNAEDIESTTDYPILTKLINDTRVISLEAESAKEEILGVSADIANSEKQRVIAEEERKENESNRSEVFNGIKKEYESLKGIMIDENNAANLQNQVNGLGSQLDNIANNHLKINVLDFGAIGDGIIDDSEAIENLINSTNNNIFQIIEFPSGYQFNISKGVNIYNKKRLLLTGGGTLINGTVAIQGSKDSDSLDITIKDLTCEIVYHSEYHPKEISAITLAKCAKINIFDCIFKSYGKTIKFLKVGEDSHQQISRINIQRNIFENVDYCMYNDDISSNHYLTGDTTFNNNNVYLAWKGVLRMSGRDGLLMTGNTIFTPRHTLPEDMFWLNKFNYVRIESNQLFESGLCTIKALNGENLNVLNNNVPYGGQNALSSAIYVEDCVMVSIQGNLIERNSDYGINIQQKVNYCSFVNVSNNIIREIGINPHYRGNDLSNSSKAPINVSSGVTRCLVDGNITDEPNVGVYNNGNNVYDDVFQKNLDLDTKADKNRVTCIAQPNELALSGNNTLIKMMVNKRVNTNFLTYDDGTNMIVDDTGTPRTLKFVQIETYRKDFNIIHYVMDGDIRNKFTQHKVYQIF